MAEVRSHLVSIWGISCFQPKSAFCIRKYTVLKKIKNIFNICKHPVFKYKFENRKIFLSFRVLYLRKYKRKNYAIKEKKPHYASINLKNDFFQCLLLDSSRKTTGLEEVSVRIVKFGLAQSI